MAIRLRNSGCGCPPCGENACACLAAAIADPDTTFPLVACGGTWSAYGYAGHDPMEISGGGWSSDASGCDQGDTECCKNLDPRATPVSRFTTWSHGALSVEFVTDLMDGLAEGSDVEACAIADFVTVPFTANPCLAPFVAPHVPSPMVSGAVASWTGEGITLDLSGLAMTFFYRDLYNYPSPLSCGGCVWSTLVFPVAGASPEQFLVVHTSEDWGYCYPPVIIIWAFRVVKS